MIAGVLFSVLKSRVQWHSDWMQCGMKTRRSFIKHLVTASLAAAVPIEAYARKRPESSTLFTRKVRERTKGLSVSGRWKWIVGHHSAIKNGNAAIYDKEHRRRGMENGLAYHFVIGNGIDSGDGEIEIGPRWVRQIKGGHVHREDINEVGIGICLVGNFEDTIPTSNQLKAFRELVDYLRSDVVGKKVRFAVHKEIDPGRTVCPGRYFPVAHMHRMYGPLTRITAA
jgi:hypothetical protein